MSTGRQVNHTQHRLALFDSDDSRAIAVASFVIEARSRKEPAAVLATGTHWEAIVRAAGRNRGVISEGLAEGSIAFRDAEVLLYDISRGGFPRPELFKSAIAELVRSLPSGRPHIYGELVDVLAARGEFDAALRLEQLWNELLAREPITLLCGYDATVFGPERATERLRAVRQCHTETRMSPDDSLGCWLLTQAAVGVGNP